ncbi:DUF4446 family protein [Nocardioidaceae bacterium SCSIO 66511]|nr:DUF4446 family protein [Nocardioidaceae bacterium SCSIO 66511]
MQSDSVALVLAVIACVLAVVGAALAGIAWRDARAVRRRRASTDALPADVEVLRDEVQALRQDAAETFRHMSAVRYDAFGDMGGHMSWSLALLDDGGDGIVITSIHGRSDSRTYVKNIADWSCDQQLSPEESEAVEHAKAGR